MRNWLRSRRGPSKKKKDSRKKGTKKKRGKDNQTKDEKDPQKKDLYFPTVDVDGIPMRRFDAVMRVKFERIAERWDE